MVDRSGGTSPRRLTHLARLCPQLPEGVRLYALGADGRALVADREGARELGPPDGMRRFIDEGQFAHYLVGDAATSPGRPSNATYKLGVVAPRSAFTPHAHGGEHIVLSLGHAECGLWDAAQGRAASIALPPGLMIRIPELMPHSFGNRGRRPLHILAANTGYGIDHDDYAITARDAEQRAAAAPEFGPLAAALRSLGREGGAGPGALRIRERLAARLRDLATTLERPR
ncbi:cupin domain-containing protein [Streptomyces radicis]|uniref:cupin domain-containing protein n=1 Tax=Streptomyces radicis TaxID=1750517 RepID=UPI001E591D22|nr:cupin domain-containing protein [Streptomyces radicis]